MASDPRSVARHLNAVVGALEAAHEVRPHQLVDLVVRASAQLGATATRIWLVDHGQRNLVHLAGAGRGRKAITIDGSVAGRAYIARAELVRERPKGGQHLWLPLVDGVDRIGVLDVEHPCLDPDLRRAYRHLASVTAAELITRGQYTDLFTVTRRRRPMSVAAEMQWAGLPPTSFTAPEVSVGAMVEPAYETAGDTFDYAHRPDALDFAIFDSVGHDLGSAVIASLTLGAYRNRRREGDDLIATGACLDEVIASQVGAGAFATGLLATLDTATGALTWLNGGHPPPLLVRGGRSIVELAGSHRLPFGLGHLSDEGAAVVQEQLEPGDAVLLYTDGLVEARQSNGEDFGLERLEEALERAFAAHLSPAETVRRLSNEVVDHHGGSLQDDASTLLVLWHPDGQPA